MRRPLSSPPALTRACTEPAPAPMYTHSLLLYRGSLQTGEATVLTDVFALGVTVLMALTGLPSASIKQRCRHMFKWPTQPSRW